MIRDLLDANRIKAGEGIPISITERPLDTIVAPVASDLRELYGTRFVVRHEIGALSVRWDLTAVQRVMENAVGNAVEYGSLGTPVTLALMRDGDWVEISVQNQGSVISPDDQLTIFDQFRRSDSAEKGVQKGWGIGLTLVRGIAEAHGGTARVESGPERGTTFTIRLPMDARPTAPERGRLND